MKIRGAALMLPLFLGGCGLPPTAQAISWAFDGVSLAFSGKSMTDHALSAVSEQDCSLFRVVNGKEVCVPNGEGETETALLDGMEPGTQRWAVNNDMAGSNAEWDVVVAETEPAQPAPTELAALPVAEPAPAAPIPAGLPQIEVTARHAPPQLAAVTRTADTPPLTPMMLPVAVTPVEKPEVVKEAVKTAGLPVVENQMATYTVVGSFRNQDNAKGMAHLYGADAAIVPVILHDETYYRVVIDRPLNDVVKTGVSDAWSVRLCDVEGDLRDCGQLVVSSSGAYLASSR